MKVKELREKKIEELSQFILDRRKELFNLRFQKAANKLQNIARMREVRRSVAVAKTLINERSQKGT